jgi:phosphoribosyl-ATP pyrophosphohydrolase/phosphoribosyl-AMP cyclohydrolase
MILHDGSDIETLTFDTDGLVPVIAQDVRTGEVLMMAWSNRVALERTLSERRVCYWSRSRNELWRKGDTSGNHQSLVSLHADCDRDVVLALVRPAGPACHTGEDTCFGTGPVLRTLGDVVRERMNEGDDSSYTRRLLADENLRLKKLGEEAVELAVACGSGDSQRIAAEAADLLYHTLVACAAAGVGEAAILGELANRRTAG